jgi:5'-phosphate synthase pdxT subunit
MTVGVLALQGDFREHIAMFESLGVDAIEVRTAEELESVEGLVIPGGESTTIGRLATMFGLKDPIRKRIAEGMPAFGTCAGMIFLASNTVGHDQPQLEVLDAVVERNAFGRQVDSFEAELEIEGFDAPIHAVFIRAPWIAKVGGDVEILAAVTDANGTDHPVLVRQGRILASSFHPELTDDPRLHRLFVSLIEENQG